MSGKKPLYFSIGPTAYKNSIPPVYSDAMYCIYCKSKYIYSNYIYGHLGDFKCPNCGYMTPFSKITCSSIYELSSTCSLIRISIDNLEDGKPYKKESHMVRINLPGIYNIYNSLAALSCGVLLNIPIENSIKTLNNLESGFGRMETVYAGNKKIVIILVKNPSSFTQAINLLKSEKKRIQIAFLINDRLADGTDISWLWDVSFEELQNISDKISGIYVSGDRAEDMALRLKYAGIDTSGIFIARDYSGMVREGLAKTLNNSNFYIFATYTAMLDIRKYLKDMFGLKEFWE